MHGRPAPPYPLFMIDLKPKYLQRKRNKRKQKEKKEKKAKKRKILAKAISV